MGIFEKNLSKFHTILGYDFNDFMWFCSGLGHGFLDQTKGFMFGEFRRS
jgi:hypothetical protein